MFEQTKLEVESRFSQTAEALRPGAENAALKRTTISTTLVVAKHSGLKHPYAHMMYLGVVGGTVSAVALLARAEDDAEHFSFSVDLLLAR